MSSSLTSSGPSLSASSAGSAASAHSLSFRDHPKGLAYLFFTEMWERFSFYGMRALLVLYMTQKLLFSDTISYEIYAAYMALVYTTPIIGGFLADRYLGNRKAIIWGGWIIAMGHIFLAFDTLPAFYLGLAAISAGTGLFKANISTLLGQLYAAGDRRRDAGFTLFYVGINLGAFLSPIICGLIGQTYGWHYGFGLAAIGMLSGIFTFTRGISHLEDKGVVPFPAKLQEKSFLNISVEKTIAFTVYLSVPLLALLLCRPSLFDFLLPVMGLIGCGFLAYEAYVSPKVERNRLLAILVLMVFHTSFFSLFEQAGSSLNLFTDRVIDRNLWGLWNIPTSQFQSLNPLFIIILGPLFSILWGKLAMVGKDPSPPVKFALALLQVSLGFVALLVGMSSVGNGQQGQLVSVGWIVLAYLLHTTGELCLSPIGLSMVTKLSPKRILSTVMGLWMLSIAFAHYLAGIFAKISAVKPMEDSSGHVVTTTGVDLINSMMPYRDAFKVVSVFALVMTVLLVLLIPWLRKVFLDKEVQ